MIKTETQLLLNDMAARGESVAVRQSVEAVVAVLRAATRARNDLDMLRQVARTLTCVEAAAMYSASESGAPGRVRGIAAARTDLWQAVFLDIELILCGSVARMPV